jgi:membrane fusion protein, multidrug efflux system
MTGDEALIESGISPGEKVAASGSFKLRDSALVAVIGAGPSVASAATPASAGATL